MKTKSFTLKLVFILPLVFYNSCIDPDCIPEKTDVVSPHLKELLLHYQTVDPVPEKLWAARFIINNMCGHYSYAGTEIYNYYDYAASILADTILTPEQQRDSLLAISDSLYYDLPNHRIPDSKVVDVNYLINNIDRSYEQWCTCPWASQLSFDDYLEWMLPYKTTEFQELDYWRDTLYAWFAQGLENPVRNDVEYNTTMGVADMIRNEVFSRMHRYGLYTRSGLPLLSAYLLPRQTFGNIPDYALTAVLALRAAGIPAVLDETPVGSRYTAASKWFVIKSDRGEELTSEWDVSTMIGGGFFPYERGPKVFRNTYAIDKRRLEYSQKAVFTYPFDLCKKDITERYFLVSNLELPIERAIRKQLKDRYVYIASAVRSEEQPWSIVDFGSLEHGKAVFRNMGREVLYIAMGYDGNSLIPITDPFILHKDGNVEYVDSDTLTSTLLDKWKNNTL